MNELKLIITGSLRIKKNPEEFYSASRGITIVLQINGKGKKLRHLIKDHRDKENDWYMPR